MTEKTQDLKDVTRRVAQEHDVRPIGSLQEFQEKTRKFAEWASRNYGKPIPCKECGKPFDYYEPWTQSEWNLCRLCGFDRAKKKLGTPKKFWSADLFTDFPQYSMDTHELLLNKSLWIYGPVGTGKTRLGFALCHQMLKMGMTGIVFEELKDIASRLKGAHKPPFWQSEERVLLPFVTPNVVFIDDIYGSRDDGKPEPLEQEALRILARDLNNREAHVIFTSNYKIAELEDRGFNARTTSRLRELCYEVLLDGADRRLTVESQPGA